MGAASQDIFDPLFPYSGGIAMTRLTAVFDNEAQAQAAINDLRGLGVGDAHLSFISRHGGQTDVNGALADDRPNDAANGAGKGLLAGAGVGALFGLAAAAIPGVGPFISAGILAETLGVAGGAAVAGAVVGGAAGSLAGTLAQLGYTKEDAEYYGGAVERGGILVVVDTDGSLNDASVLDVLARHGGRMRA